MDDDIKRKYPLISRRRFGFTIAPACLAIVCVLLFLAHGSSDAPLILKSICARLVKEGVPLALMAIGAGLVIAAGYVDLSVTGVATVAGAIFAALIQLSWHPVLAGIIACLVGALSGFLLALAILRCSSPALIMSWAVGVLWMIGTIVFAGSRIVSGGFSSILLSLDLSPTFWSFGGNGFFLSILLLLLTLLFLTSSRLPKFAAAVGGSEKSALYSGIRIPRVVTLCYMANGVLSALAGILWTLVISAAVTTDHIGKELIVIAIAVFGGTAMSGGVISLMSISCAALFWAGAKTWVDGLDLEAIGNLQQHAANALFALVFIVVLLIFGRSFEPFKRSLTVIQKKKN